MTSLELPKMQTKRVKSSGKNSQVFRSPKALSGHSNLLGSKKPSKVQKVSTNHHPEKVHDSVTSKTFLETPVNSDVQIPHTTSFFQNFLKTKGHLGSSKWTKDMTNSMEGVRQGFAVFDAEKTKIACSRAFHFLKTYQKPLHDGEEISAESLTSSGSKIHMKKKKLDILFVNTSEQYRHLIQKVARITHQRYIHEKWVGGTLTNWSQISQSYSLFGRFHSLFGNFLKKRKIHLPLYEKARRIYSGLLPQEIQKKKPKKSQSLFILPQKPRKTLDNLGPEDFIIHLGNDKMIFSIEKKLDHQEKPQEISTSQESQPNREMLENSNDGLPDVIFLMNPEENQNVLREANLLKIPVIALTDANTKISGIDYMIPGNVQSIKFVYWFLNCMTIILQKRNKPKKQKSITSTRKKSGQMNSLGVSTPKRILGIFGS